MTGKASVQNTSSLCNYIYCKPYFRTEFTDAPEKGFSDTLILSSLSHTNPFYCQTTVPLYQQVMMMMKSRSYWHLCQPEKKTKHLNTATVDLTQQLGFKSCWMAGSHEGYPMAALSNMCHPDQPTTAFFNLQELISLMGGDFWLASYPQEIKQGAL